jgi:tyrosine-protein kinase Etk/Wzc
MITEEAVFDAQPMTRDVSGSCETTPVSVLDLLGVVLRHKRAVIAGSLLMCALASVLMLILPPSYEARALILTPQQQQSAAAAFTSGALAGLGGGTSMMAQLGLKSPADLYIGILKSRTIADDIINDFNLKKVYGKDLPSDARKTLAGRASFTSGKDSLIVIAVSDKNPERAAALANAYIDKLYKQNSRLALTDAAQRRLFFEQQLMQEKEALANAEANLKAVEKSTGLLAPTGQAEALIRSGAELRANIASREVELQALQTFATEANPKVQVIRKELEALRSQLTQLESSGRRSSMELSAGALPDAALEYIRRARDVKYHETLFEVLSKQYEAARIDEAKQAPVIQVVDRAVVPDKSTRPPTPVLIVAFLATGLALSVIGVLAVHSLSRLRAGWTNLQAFMA